MMSQAAATAGRFGLVTDKITRVGRLRRIAWLVDGAFRVPGTRMRFGLNAPIGVAPWVGDAVLIAISLFIVWEARRLGVPGHKLRRMLANVAIEGGLGLIPWIGDLLDVGYKANLRNIDIVERHFGIIDPVARNSFWRWPFALRLAR